MGETTEKTTLSKKLDSSPIGTWIEIRTSWKKIRNIRIMKLFAFFIETGIEV
jgi:hypothetical protein